MSETTSNYDYALLARAVKAWGIELGFQAVAIATDGREPVAPCGACRQVLAEFEPELEVWSECGGMQVEWTLDQLLPEPFRGLPERGG